MQQAFGLEIPRSLEEVVDPRRLALLVYDMQVGIFTQAPNLRSMVPQVVTVLEAARVAGVRIFFLSPHVVADRVDGRLAAANGHGLAAGRHSGGGALPLPAGLAGI